MYSNNTETLMTSEEFKTLLGKSFDGKLSGGLLPGVGYLGVKYTVGTQTRVYDGNASTGNYYFETSDGMVKVDRYGTATDISKASLESQIRALPGTSSAANFEYLKCYKSDAFDPLFGYHAASSPVGTDSFVMGPGSVCAGVNSHVAGENLFVDSTCSYVSVRGKESVISGSTGVMGVMRDAYARGCTDLLLFGDESRIENVHRGTVFGGLVTGEFSELEMKWRAAVGGSVIGDGVDRVNVSGDDNILWGSANGMTVMGSHNRVGWFSGWMRSLPRGSVSRGELFEINIHGDNNWLGYNSENVAVSGDGNYIAAGSMNVRICGNNFNRYNKTDWSDIQQIEYQEAYYTTGRYADYEVLTVAEANERLNDVGHIEAVVVGNGDITWSNSQGSFAIVPFSSGVSQYIHANSQFDYTQANNVQISNGLTEEATVWRSLFDEFPTNQTNIMIFGNNNTLPDVAQNVLVKGNNNIFATGTVTDCLFYADGMRITGPDRMKVGDNWFDKNILHNVVWIDTCRHSGGIASGCLTDMGADFATPSFEDAFAFIDSDKMGASRFYGPVSRNEALNIGFSTLPTFRDTVTSTTSYVVVAHWMECNKPDVPVMYTGGLALYGRDNALGHVRPSTFGIVKLGNSSYCAPYREYTEPVSDEAMERDRRNDTETFVSDCIAHRWAGTEYSYSAWSVVLTPGSEHCPYKGMPLVIQEYQELDGSFHVGAGKLGDEGVDFYDLVNKMDLNTLALLKTKLGLT